MWRKALGGVGSLLSKWCSRMRGIVVKLKRARRFGAIVTGFGPMATSAYAGSSSQCLVRQLRVVPIENLRWAPCREVAQ